MSYPTTIRVGLLRSRKTGLLAATSEDLPGLMTVGKTIEDIEDRLPAAIAQLIKAQYDADVEVELLDGDDEGFSSLAEPRVLELHAA